MTAKTFVERFIPYGLYGGLRCALSGCETVLGLGCGTDSMLQHMALVQRIIGLDRYLPSLLANREKGRYSAWVQGDIHELPFAERSVDAVAVLDVIEHMEKKEGKRLLERLEKMARKRVVILTPNGFVPQPADDNPWQEHKSGWTTKDFGSRGDRVSGVYGRKPLRGPYSRLRLCPVLFWEMVSAALHLVTTRHSWAAYHLLAVKQVDGKCACAPSAGKANG